MLEGRLPDRPNDPELSDRVWKVIKGCWKNKPVHRKTMAEVVTVLEAELNARKRQRRGLFTPL